MTKSLWIGLILFLGLLALVAGNADPSKIKTKTTPLRLADLRWIDTNTILTRTVDYKIYLSVDGGVNWVDQTSKMPGCGQNGNFPAFLYPHALDNSKIYVRGNGTLSWRSFDSGTTWEAVNPDKRYVNLRWHPTKPDYALAQAGSDLYYTTDFAKTWGVVLKGIIGNQYDWGDSGIGAIPIDRIYAIQIKNNFAYFVETDDYGVTTQGVIDHTFQFLFLDKQLFVATYDPQTFEVKLKVTTDYGVPSQNKVFRNTEFPFGNTLPNDAYSILDDSTGAVYMGVIHGTDANPDDANLYVSDAAGARYITSLQHVAQKSFLYDFEKVKGLDGIFLANKIENYDESGAIRQKQSFFSFNNGGEWQEVNPPRFDENGVPITCPPGTRCKLNLHGLSSLTQGAYGPFYTNPSAIGLILATGNVGEYLKPDQTNTFLSTDAGITWTEIKKGSSIYEFGDHGGILLLGDFGVPTNKLYYSFDEATTLPLPVLNLDRNITIINIISEPSATGEKFLVLGLDVVISVDFTQVFDRTCDLQADYYLWSPSDDREKLHGRACLLGRTVTYRRRKTTSLCFNDENVERIGDVQNCACIRDDYECDFDFQEDDNGNCVLIPGKSLVYPPDYCPVGSSYSKTQGYRLIADDTCQGGVDLNPVGSYPCPNEDKNLTKKGVIAAAIVIPLVCCCLFISLLLARSSKVQHKLPFLKVFGTWNSGYFASRPQTLVDDQEDSEFTVGIPDQSPFSPRSKLPEANTNTSINSSKPATDPAPLIALDPPSKPETGTDDFNPRA